MKRLFPQMLLLGLFLMGMVGCTTVSDEESLKTYARAQELFDKAESLPEPERQDTFRRAALTYRSLIERGIQSGPIYYNMGNAWARCEERGQAVAAYLLAQRYMPLEQHVASNMQTVLAGTVPVERSTPVMEYLFFWQNWLGQRQKVLLAFVFALATFIVGTFYLFLAHRRLRRMAVGLLIATLIMVVSVGYDWYRFEYQIQAVVAIDGANPRKGNSEQYELSFTDPIPLGTQGTVLGNRSGWVHLGFGSDKEGWLPEEQIIQLSLTTKERR